MLGVEDLTRNESITVGTTSLQVAITRPRRSIYFRNSSAANQVITLVNSSVMKAVSGAGIVIKAGEAYVDSNQCDDEGRYGYMCYQGAYQAISDAAGAILSVSER